MQILDGDADMRDYHLKTLLLLVHLQVMNDLISCHFSFFPGFSPSMSTADSIMAVSCQAWVDRLDHGSLAG